MSASNWAICPKCKIEYEKANEKKLAKVQSRYGKIPSDEFVNQLKETEEVKEIQETLREDYEIYTEDSGTFYVSYKCFCEVCKLKFEFKRKLDILVGEKDENND